MSIIRALFLLVLALVLMTLDVRSPRIHEFRNKLAVVVLPVQYLVSAPIRAVHSFGASITMQKKLVEENARLHARELLLQSKLQKLLVLQKENTQLRMLLQSTSEISGRVVVAQLLAVSLDPRLQQVILDRGSHIKVYNGQPVLDAFGVMGQVVDVGPLTSKVLLLTDTRSAVPVQDYRNGLRAIAVGQGITGKLNLINVTNATNIKQGDLFVTSGLGLHYPVGYPVGVVSAIQKTPRQQFTQISLVPSAHLDQTQQVLLVWPSKAALFKAVQSQLQQPLPGNDREAINDK